MPISQYFSIDNSCKSVSHKNQKGGKWGAEGMLACPAPLKQNRKQLSDKRASTLQQLSLSLWCQESIGSSAWLRPQTACFSADFGEIESHLPPKWPVRRQAAPAVHRSGWAIPSLVMSNDHMCKDDYVIYTCRTDDWFTHKLRHPVHIHINQPAIPPTPELLLKHTLISQSIEEIVPAKQHKLRPTNGPEAKMNHRMYLLKQVLQKHMQNLHLVLNLCIVF